MSAVATVPQSDLTQAQKDRFKELEGIIEKGIGAWYQVGTALLEIKNDKLYFDAGYDNFKSYCDGRWSFSDRYARYLTQAVRLLEDDSEQPSNNGKSDTSGSSKRKRGSASSDKNGSKKTTKKSSKSSKQSESSEGSKSTGNDAKSDMLPDLVLYLRGGTVSPKLVPEVAKLTLAQQQVFLDLVREEGENPREALAKAQAKGQPTKHPKNGKPVFDDREIENLLGKLVRTIDARAAACGKTAGYRDMEEKVELLIKSWRRWQLEKEKKG